MYWDKFRERYNNRFLIVALECLTLAFIQFYRFDFTYYFVDQTAHLTTLDNDEAFLWLTRIASEFNQNGSLYVNPLWKTIVFIYYWDIFRTLYNPFEPQKLRKRFYSFLIIARFNI